MSMLSAAEAAGIRATLGLLLAHTYTRTPISQGTDDAWYDAADVAGTPATAQACLYRPNRRLVLSDGSRVTVDEPNLRIPIADPLAVGDRVSDIADMDGTPLAAGPFVVQSLEPIAGLGDLLQVRATLLAAGVAE